MIISVMVTFRFPIFFKVQKSKDIYKKTLSSSAPLVANPCRSVYIPKKKGVRRGVPYPFGRHLVSDIH